MMGALTKGELRVTVRDVSLLRALHTYRCLSVSQVRKLFFPSHQTTCRRLRYLQRSRHVSVEAPPGVPERIVRLAREGKTVLESLDPSLGSIHIRRSAPKDHYFVEHLLALNQFRIVLERACESREDVTLHRFIAEYEGEQRAAGLVQRKLRGEVTWNGQRLGHTPDGVFALSYLGKPALFFLEIDRGTEVIGRADRGVGKLLQFYLGLLISGTWKRYLDHFELDAAPQGFRLLFMTTSKKRLSNIRAASQMFSDVPSKAKQFLWLSTMGQMGEGLLNTPCFQSLDPDDSKTYAILPTKGD